MSLRNKRIGCRHGMISTGGPLGVPHCVMCGSTDLDKMPATFNAADLGITLKIDEATMRELRQMEVERARALIRAKDFLLD